MSIRIDSETCAGCGKCICVCPGNLIGFDSAEKAAIKRPRDCWGCASCLKECAFGAIRYYLGADIGGRGSVMTVQKRGTLTDWIITSPDGGRDVITVDAARSNEY
jgi:adenylylsulfate reductase subunit B